MESEFLSPLSSDWQKILSLLPSHWKSLARDKRAVSKRLFNFTEETMLRSILMHTGCGYSLRETSARVKAGNIANVTPVSIFKALKRSEHWLHALCKDLYFDSGDRLPLGSDLSRNIRLVDGTIVKEPGKTGSLWRINYSFSLPNLECDDFNISPVKGAGNGETLRRTKVEKGDCIIADKSYSRFSEIDYVKSNKGDIITKVNQQSLVICNKDGEVLNLLSLLSKLKRAGKHESWDVYIKDKLGNKIKGRICAVKKNKEAVAKSQLRIKKRAQASSTKLKKDTLEYAKYLTIFTTIEEQECCAKEILGWYRVRWQIELAFKRLKSLAGLGHLPKYDAASCRAWIYGKLLMGLLTEKMIRLSKTLSPWGYGFLLE